MNNAPRVEALAQSIASLEPAFEEQRALLGEQIEGLGARSDISRQRLEGARVAGFNTINEQATGRGLSFSGIPLAEQSDLLATQFLPGLQEIELAEGAERQQLRSQIAQLNTQQNTAALSRVDQQQSALNSWNLAQAQLEAQRRENDLQRQFDSRQAELDRTFKASQNAADRASSAANSSAGVGVYETVFANFSNTTGVDRFVSPTNYAQQKALAAKGGLSGAEFDRQFSTFRNPRDTGYRLG